MSQQLAHMAWQQSWQLALLILMIGLVSRCCSRRNPHLAWALWVVVLIKCLTPPIWQSPVGLFSRGQAAWQSYVSRAADDSRIAGTVLPQSQHIMLHMLSEQDGVTAVQQSKAEPVPTDRATARGAHDLFASRVSAWLRQVAAQLVPLWLAGMAAMLIIAIVRWHRCLRSIKLAPTVTRMDLQHAVTQLAARLRLRRRVRLVVSQAPVGPAVIGYWRSTILLPAIVAQGRSPAQLEPILAHELLHVRRGDTLLGMLQTLAHATWWFHPLMWCANRNLSRHAERCCDEQAVAELGIQPVRYARCLLDVLEQKTRLRPAPSFPGMRPVEITSQRLERIMRLGHGCRRQTPWWCWLILGAVAAATLPGAALVSAQQSSTEAPAATDSLQAAPAIPRNAKSDVSQPQLLIRAKLLRGSRRELGRVWSEWPATSSDSSPEKSPEPSSDSTTEGQQRDAAPTIAVVDHADAEQFVQRLVDHRHATVISRPTLMVHSGQNATVAISSRPPVSGHRRSADGTTSRVRVDHDTEMQILPMLLDDGTMRIETQVTLTDVRNVDVRKGGEGADGKPMQPPSPEVSTRHIKAAPKFSVGKTLLLTDLKCESDQLQDEALLVVLEVEKISAVLHGVGVNSDTGIAGTVVFDERLTPAKPIRAGTDADPRDDQGEDQSFEARVYPVADLVVPVPPKLKLPETLPSPRPLAQPKPDFTSLIEKIESTVVPQSWAENGGRGTIEEFPSALSLVIWQTGEVHEQIAASFERLRKQQDVQIVLQMYQLEVEERFWETLGLDFNFDQPQHGSLQLTINDGESKQLVKAAQDNARSSIAHCPKVTVFDQQAVELMLRPDLRVQLSAHVSTDRESVRLNYVTDAEDALDAIGRAQSVTLRAGQSLLIELATTESLVTPEPVWLQRLPYVGHWFTQPPQKQQKSTMLLITPRIIEVEN